MRHKQQSSKSEHSGPSQKDYGPLTTPALLLLAVSAVGCGAAPMVSTDNLPLRRVVVYRNGVGYFERAGYVNTNEVRFRVRGNEVGDFLATMAVIEKGGSSVRSASFPIKVEEKKEKTLSPEEPPLSPGSPESPGPPSPPHPSPYPHGAVPSLAVAHEKFDPSKLVTVLLELDGQKHNLQVGYVAETPVWRPSYRLVVQKGGADLQAWGIVQNLSGEDWNHITLSLVAGAPLAFQATLGTPVIPERPEVTDSGEVIQSVPQSETSLKQEPPPPPAPAAMQTNAAPSPDDEEPTPGSLAQDATRRENKKKKGMRIGSAGGQAVSAQKPKSMQDVKPQNQSMGSLSRAVPKAPSPVGPAGFATEQAVARARENPSAPRNLSALAAIAVEGSSTRYDIPNPVTIPNKSATMVMLLSKRVSGESIMLFAPAPGVPDSSAHPFRVARFTNQTNGLLERGPIAVFEEGAFLGQGIVDPLPPGATATVPFALERSVAVESAMTMGEEGARIAQIEAGALTIERDVQYKTKYTIKNGQNQDVRMLVKHARRHGTRLFQSPKGTEDNLGTASALVPLDIVAHGTNDISVEERIATQRPMDWLSPLADEAVRAYMADSRADAHVVSQLRAAWDIRPALVKAANESKKLEDEQRELSRDAEETRSNLKSLEKNTAAGALRAQLTERLAKTSLHLNEIAKRLVELSLMQNEQHVRFTEAVRAIKLNKPLPAPSS